MNCVNHENIPASGTCTYCGKFYCSDCLVEVNGKMVCREDVGKIVNEANSQAASAVSAAAVAAAAAASQPIINVNNANNNVNTNTNNGGFGAYPQKSKLTALLLCLFLGVIGVHRFYVGKIGTGILYFFTFGLFGFGVLIDLILIAIGSFRDKYGMPLL